jgi:hypothetical protein
MRRCDILCGILLVISIINFALAAPVLVQEKRGARVDVVYIPKDVITVLGKRTEEDDLEKMWEDYFDNLGSQSDEESSTPSEHDHGSTNVAQAPAPKPASSTANPDPMSDFVSSYKGDDELHWPHYTSSSSGYGSDLDFMEAHAAQNHPMSWTDSDSSTDPDLDRNYQVDPLDPPSTSGYAPSRPEPEHEVVTPSPPSSNLGSPNEPEDEVVPADSQPVDPQAAI